MNNFYDYLIDIKFDGLKTKSIQELETLLEQIYSFCDEKYNKVNGNYFTENWKKNTIISRGKEGLDVHHKKEYVRDDNEVCSLSLVENAQLYPYEYQLAENLVYCNWIEHQSIHAVIDTLRTKQFGEYRPGCIARRAPMLNRYFNEKEEYLNKLNEHCSYFRKSLNVIKDEIDAYSLIMDEWANANGIDDWLIFGYNDDSFENCFNLDE